MIRLAPIVMAHHSRTGPAWDLVDALDADMHVDFDDAGPWANARECWLRTMPEGCTHRLVIQDDALLCKDFLTHARAAVAARPNEIVSFYTGRKEILAARKHGYSWVEFDVFCAGVALCLPADLCVPFVSWADKHIRQECRKDDLRLLLWAIAAGRRIHCTAPSLVQHNPALVGIDDHTINGADQSPWFQSSWGPIDFTKRALYVPGDRAAFTRSRVPIFL